MNRFATPAAFVCVVVATIVATATAAAAHGGPAADETSSNYRTRIATIEPATPDVSARTIDAGARLEVTNRGMQPLVVLGYDGEPYLRIGRDGVFENRRSAATYLNERRDGGVTVPDIVDPAAPPEWRRVSRGSTARWHDHRAHWMSTMAPPAVRADPGTMHMIYDPWVVPMQFGDTAVELRGDLAWVPPPSSTRWWTVTIVAFAIGALALARTPSAWLRAGALGLVAVADLVATAGVVAVSAESAFNRTSQFLYAALLALAAARVALGARRDAPGPHLAQGLAAVLALGMSGASRLDGFSSSQVATSLSGPLDRSLTASVLAIGALLLVDFVLGLRRPGATAIPVVGSDTGTNLTPELVR